MDKDGRILRDRKRQYSSMNDHPSPSKRPRISNDQISAQPRNHRSLSFQHQRQRKRSPNGPVNSDYSQYYPHQQKRFRIHHDNDYQFSEGQPLLPPRPRQVDPNKVVREICSQFELFEELVSFQIYHDDKHIIELVNKLSHVVKADTTKCHRERTRIFELLLSEKCFRGFFFCLTYFIRQIPMDGDEDKKIKYPHILETIISLFDASLEWDGIKAANMLPVDVCVGTTQQLSLQSYCYQEINEKAQKMVQKRNKICSDIYESRVKCSPSSGLSIALPSPEELHNVPAIKENIIDKPFPSTEEYLTIQRNLLREDFVNPLRSELSDDPQKKSKLKFTNVKFSEGQTITSSGISAYNISFKTSRKHINWSRCKALKYGSLVCLSEDNFRTVLYATVVEREVDELKEGLLTVQPQNYDERLLSPSREFVMIESPGYFKAFAPVIEKLNKMTPEELPFSEYLVQLQTVIDTPAYLRNKRALFDLKSVVCDCRVEICPHSQVDVLDFDSWQSLDTPVLDDSQKNALHLALTKELALIQGPPGTGKTYIGLRMVKALLQNGHFWKYKAQGTCPIVIVCYTNHALDQFLEAVVDLNILNTQIIRVGEQSKSEKVKQFSLLKKIYEACRLRRGRGYHYNPKKSLQATGVKIQALRDFLTGNYVRSRHQLYCGFMTEDILHDLQFKCDINLSFLGISSKPLSLASWLDDGIKHKVELFKRSRDEEMFRLENDDRYDELETRNLYTILQEKGLQTFIQRFGAVRPMSKERACQTFLSSEWSPQVTIRCPEKLPLFKHCLTTLLEELTKQQELSAEQQRFYDKQMEGIKLECLQEANVVGLTTTAAARDNELMSKVESKILIVEEAAEVLEPQLIATLTKQTQHLILIGDHQQLRPKTNDYVIGHHHKLEISMFERLVRNKLPHATLTVQHRMRPEISQIVSRHIYHNKLRDHESTKGHENIKGMKHNLYFINHDKEETPEEIDPSNRSNLHEANFIVSLCKYLIQQEYDPDKITVITPYMGQFYELRSQFKHKHKSDISSVRITTIDSYQGEENDIILLSLVRSNKKGKAGFVKEENRICVALSRAKCGLYCIGNFNLFEKSSEMWSSIVTDLKAKNLLGESLQLYCDRHKVEIEVSSAEDFEANVPEGGCNKPCEEIYKDCGHVCPRKCHPDDRDHTSPCPLPCLKKCESGLHECKRLCFQDCGYCTVKVPKIIPSCQHKQLVPCYMPPERFFCKARCEKILPCRHRCSNSCSKECDVTRCKEKVQRELLCGHKAKAVECYLTVAQATKDCAYLCDETLTCGHKCSGKCGKCRQGRLHTSCKMKCTKKLPCGHLCSGKCSEICGPCREKCAYSCEHGWCGNKCKEQCKPCKDPCVWKCRHEQCTRLCGKPCNRRRCDKPCNKRLKCGHPCFGLCGETCPPVCHKCDSVRTKVSKIYSDEKCHFPNGGHQYIVLEDCGHVFSVQSLDRWMEREIQEEMVDIEREEGDLQEEEMVEDKGGERLGKKEGGIHEARMDSLLRTRVVEWKRCPLDICKKPVTSTLRYANIAKQVLCDMNEMKEKLQDKFLSSQLRQNMLSELSSIPGEELKEVGGDPNSIKDDRIKDVKLQKKYVCYSSAVDVLRANSEIKELLTYLEHGRCDGEIEKDMNSIKIVLLQACDFLSWVRGHLGISKLSEQMILDISAERKRFVLLKKYYTMKHYYSQADLSTDVNLQVQENLDEDVRMLKIILSNETIDECIDHMIAGGGAEQEDQEKIEMVKKIVTNPFRRIPLTSKERERILSEVGARMSDGVWYRCPNGHFYNGSRCKGIGDHHVNVCPECN